MSFEERQRERVAHVARIGVPPSSPTVVGGLPCAKAIQAATMEFAFACSRSFPCNPKMASNVYVKRLEYAFAVVQPELLPPSAQDRIEFPIRSKERPAARSAEDGSKLILQPLEAFRVD